MSKEKVLSFFFKIAALAVLCTALLQASPRVPDADATIALSFIGCGLSWCAGMYDMEGNRGLFLSLLATMAALPVILGVAFALMGGYWMKLAVVFGALIISAIAFASARSRFAHPSSSQDIALVVAEYRCHR